MGVGDVDGDGFVTYVDVNTVAGYSKYGVNEEALYDYDVDGDGSVNYVDVNIIAGLAWYGNSDTTYFVVSAKAVTE
jgi:hypothetical protein